VQGSEDDGLADLMRAACEGDEAAYADVLRRIAVLVRVYARRRIAGSGAALDPEDIVQETLLAIHLKRHTWRHDEPILPWIYGIARYKLIDAHRRRGRRVEVGVETISETLAAPEQDSASEREIGRALDGLGSGQRSVVSAIAIEGRSIAETAAHLNMREGAVRVALHRGLAAIAARFGRS
jgi:RNA polymerase sigma-70 factor (ECF subfamily)